jgi:UDP-N-acetylmuramate dehydrogenase
LAVHGKRKRCILTAVNQLAIAKNVSLQAYSTMRLGGSAAYAVGVTSRQEVAAAHAWAKQYSLPVLMVGSGSNVIWRDEGFPGLLIINQIKHFELFEEDAENTYVTLGAGENWDQAVARCVAAGLTGVEALSLIPGTAGATPVQNVGAYGQDISQTLSSIEAYDTSTDNFITIPTGECGFGYRTSRFKTTDRGRFFITAVTLHLRKANPEPPFYNGLQKYLDEQDIREYTPQSIRKAVIAIRSSKLPNPNQVANNGSFFANPVIDEDIYIQIAADYESVPHWPVSSAPGDSGSATDLDTSKIKLSAAWLIDQAGFKDYHDEATGMATWPSQSLVLVNEHAKTTADLLVFKQKITDAVQAKFSVTLEQEPELLPHQS